jgi:hypothetical protein
MIECALILATLLHRSPSLIEKVYQSAGLDGVSVVWCESRFVKTALREEPRGHTSWGLFQLNNEWHPQYRNNLNLHIAIGASFLADCKRGRSFRDAVAVYNGGPKPKAYSIRWGKKVEKKRDNFALYLWRHLR